MENTRTSIFTFDHGQKKLNKAIGVEESYMDDLQEKIADTLKDYLFDEHRNMREDLSPSMLVEKCLHEFSYNQLVIMASFFLQNKLEDFANKLEEKVSGMKATVKKIAVDPETMPPHIKEALMKFMMSGKGLSKGTAISGDDLPQEIKDYLDSLARDADDADDDED